MPPPADDAGADAAGTSVARTEDTEALSETAPGELADGNESEIAFRPLPLVTFCLATAVIFAMALWLPPEHSPGGLSLPVMKGAVIGLVFLLVLIMASLIHRESDEEVVDAIEAERTTARSQALSEFAWLLPACLVGAGVFFFLRHRDWAGVEWHEALKLLGMNKPWTLHAAAAAEALAAGTLAAGMGWIVRILGTLTFGKEAFGTGDIYIMAAIGAAAGFWVMFFSFFIAALLALVGVLATAFAKSSRALPFGPWLALGTFVAFWFQKPLLDFCSPAGSLLWSYFSGVNSWLD